MIKIQSLVPAGEHFDPTALNEGIWFTVAHVNAIESALVAAGQTATTLTGERDAFQSQLTEAKNGASTAATKAAEDLQAANTKITALEAQIEALKKGPAAGFTETTAQQDRQADTKNQFETSVDKDLKEMRNKMGIK